MWPRPFDSIDEALAGVPEWRTRSDPSAYFAACFRVAAALDHRCDRPAVVATALVMASRTLGSEVRMEIALPQEALVSLAHDARRVCEGAWEHPQEPSPDVAVLSDALLHPAGADSTSTFVDFDLALASGHTLVLSGRAFPSLAELINKPSVYYTPEARSRLEARSRMNIWRRGR